MVESFDLSQLKWTLAGWPPHGWRFLRSRETQRDSLAEIAPCLVSVPGSVQEALRKANVIPDWNVGANARACEWVENRHWIYTTHIPAGTIPSDRQVLLRADGLDYSGWVLVDDREIGSFEGSLTPHVFDLTGLLTSASATLEIVFDTPPRWLGQFGYTSQITEWKPRFNYTWDWMPRLVQIGIWDTIALEFTDGRRIQDLSVYASADPDRDNGHLFVQGSIAGALDAAVVICVSKDGRLVCEFETTAPALARGIELHDLPIERWNPSGSGRQPLYELSVKAFNSLGLIDRQTRRVGFRSVTWQSNKNSPVGADPWICVVNGKPTFLQGVNWTPIRPNFADVSDDDYRQRITLYQDLGANLLRVWGGAFLEKKIFYDLCDEMGLMVWQEFPLAASCVDSWPPEDERSIAQMEQIARSYISRRRHHPSLILWCGGNEMQCGLDGDKCGIGVPVTRQHPLIGRLAETIEGLDPDRRFLPASSSGPRFMADAADYGKGLHWDVHGPWALDEMSFKEWTGYWERDDALFRSEAGAPSASGADLIRAYLGDYLATPGTLDNELWRRTSWWIEWPAFVLEHGREPYDIEEYVGWSQTRQTRALSVALAVEKRRFPGIGGMLIWMGHDAFPCAANTSIVDFWGRPKPAALAVGRIWCASHDALHNCVPLNPPYGTSFLEWCEENGYTR